MKYLMFIMLPFLATGSLTLYDFHKDSNLESWIVVDDVVMGGRSQGEFFLSEEGTGVFRGKVSLENNGGFSSVRYRFDRMNIEEYSQVHIRLKGDGKRYQFRVKTSTNDYQSYITYFETSGKWETIKIDLYEMYPSFRGQRLNMPNYPGEIIAEISFLIANYKAEEFRLEIDKIELSK
jgi:hypothetical protein